MVRSGQKMTWDKNVKTLTSELAHVGEVRQNGWSPRDPPGDKS